MRRGKHSHDFLPCTSSPGGGGHSPRPRGSIRHALSCLGLPGRRDPSLECLSHGGTGRSRRCLQWLWLPAGLVQLLPRPALPQVPRRETCRMVAVPAGALAARGVLPRGLHAAGGIAPLGTTPSTAVVRLALSGRFADVALLGGRPQTVGCTDWRDGHPTHLGAKSDVSSTPALCRHRRRAESRRQSLGGRRPGTSCP